MSKSRNARQTILVGLSENELVELFRSIAGEQCEVPELDYKTWNKMETSIVRVLDELRMRGLLLSLIPLLEDPNPNIRLQTAAGVWEVSPTRAQLVFDKMRSGLIGRWKSMAYTTECMLKDKVL